MCGFAGEVAVSRRPDVDAVARMAEVLAPRGPDGHGAWTEGGVALAHRRLKVIDLSERGRQPMVDEQDGLVIVFNGCVYNHRELRRELEAGGARFTSGSDTEVILKAYAAWGTGCVERLIGMWAFAIVETATGRVVLSRDRLGIKPLYLAQVGSALRFASTLPALLAGGGVDTALDPVALHHFFSWHAVVPAPRTVLAGVRKLPPASVMVVEPDGTSTTTTFWSARFARDERHAGMDEHEWAGALLAALRVAVDRRMVADVPVGVLLSGGLDSSIIVALLAQAGQRDLATFSIGFDAGGGREGDEFAYSDLVAREYGTDHTRWRVGADDVVAALPGAIGAMSEPMVSHDAVAFFLLAEEVSASCKVVQSGQGADEVLAGYSWYADAAAAREGSGEEEYAAAFFDRPDAEMDELLAPAVRAAGDPSRAFVHDHFARPGAGEPVDRALRLDTEVMLVEDPVKRLDTMTMAWGLEARTPFLDHELVELAAACPPALKLARGGKGILKAAARGVVPDAVIDRPKGYFPVPLLSTLEGPALELVADALTSRAARERGLFRREHVDALLAEPAAHQTTLEGSKLWQLGLLELWLQRHVG